MTCISKRKALEIIRELKDRLQPLYGSRLKGSYLFGSHSREEADEESDIDVLLVLDKIDNYSAEVERISAIVSELSIKHGHSMSCVFATEKNWREDQTMFYLNVREEAVSA